MANTVPSSNMNMPLPVVGVDPGPDYATDLVSCLTILDGHDHSAGNGVAISPDGLNINSDLSFNNSNLTQARSLRLYPQSVALSAPTDIGCLYEVGDDLYYNDGSGNHVRITQSGAVAGTPGSIANLVSPASATYVSGTSTFVWQSDVLTPANMDGASYIFRNLTASSFGLTLSPPNAMGANYALVLPSLPASQKFMTLDASGNMGAPWAVDNSTLEISSNTVQVKDLGISQAKLANNSVGTAQLIDLNVTKAKLSASNNQSSADAGSGTTSTSFVDVPGMSVTITTTGRPVLIFVSGGSSGSPAYCGLSGTTSSSTQFNMTGMVSLVLDVSTGLGTWQFFLAGFGNNGNTDGVRSNPSILYVDTPSAGSHTYKLQYKVLSSSSLTSPQIEMFGKLNAIEL